MEKRPLRTITPPFVVAHPTGVSIHDRLKHLTPEDEQVLWEVGNYLASLAGQDLRRHCQDGLNSDKHSWSDRYHALAPLSSSRWSNSITRHTHAQWALARRGQQQRIDKLKTEIAMLEHRLSLPLRARGTRYEPGGYKTPHEWWTKSRRLATLKDRLANLDKDRVAGKVTIVRGGKRLVKNRHNLETAGLSESEWQMKWGAARLFLQAVGANDRRFGNETIRVTDTGQLSLRLPTPLSHLANAPHNRYEFTGTVKFAHRHQEWRDRITADFPVSYKIHFNFEKQRWYVTASWARPETKTVPIEAALASGCIGVDTNHDHLAAWRLDSNGNPVGEPQRFPMDLAGSTDRRDAQIRHALASLLRWAKRAQVGAIAIEDLNFDAEKTREKYGRNRQFRSKVNGFPVAKLKQRIASMATNVGISIVAVNAAYTSKWGGEHWQEPLTTPNRKATRHDAASIVIGRRAQGFKARRRKSPPRSDQSDRRGHRSLQAEPRITEREETRRRQRGSLSRAAPPRAVSTRETSVPNPARGTPVNSVPTLFAAQESAEQRFPNRPEHPTVEDRPMR